MTRVYLGTSGFAYREWIGGLYPAGTKAADMLRAYARRFSAVELDNTFYRLPSEASIRAWRASVPPGFRFAVKASQRITHRPGFGLADGFFTFFLSRIRGLGDYLGPILFQFPPYFSNPESLLDFAQQVQEWIPRRVPATPVVEVRHPRLLRPEVYARLAEQRVNICCNDAYLEPEDWPPPVDIAYVRLRREDYSRETLQAVAQRLAAWSRQGKTSYVFFKHEPRAPELTRSLELCLSETRQRGGRTMP